jgi:hypothetical protein
MGIIKVTRFPYKVKVGEGEPQQSSFPKARFRV